MDWRTIDQATSSCRSRSWASPADERRAPVGRPAQAGRARGLRRASIPGSCRAACSSGSRSPGRSSFDPEAAADGRAVRGARRDDPRADEHRAHEHLAADRHDHRVRHPQHPGGGLPVDPGRRHVGPARPDRRGSSRSTCPSRGSVETRELERYFELVTARPRGAPPARGDADDGPPDEAGRGPHPGGGPGVTVAGLRGRHRRAGCRPSSSSSSSSSSGRSALPVLDVQSFLIPRPSVIVAAARATTGRRSGKGVLFTGTEAVGGLIVGVVLGTVARPGDRALGDAPARSCCRSRSAPARSRSSPSPRSRSTGSGRRASLPRITIVGADGLLPGHGQHDPRPDQGRSGRPRADVVVRRRATRQIAAPSCGSRTPCRTGSRRCKIATTLSVIGAVVGEFFGGPLYCARDLHHVCRPVPVPLPDGLGGDRARVRPRDRAVPGGRRARAARRSRGTRRATDGPMSDAPVA